MLGQWQKRFCVSSIISDCKLEGSASFDEICIFNEIFCFYNLNSIQISSLFDTHGLIFVYAAQTSGITGEPKTVYVPKKCIESNIKDMKEEFLKSEEKCVFWGTHPRP